MFVTYSCELKLKTFEDNHNHSNLAILQNKNICKEHHKMEIAQSNMYSLQYSKILKQLENIGIHINMQTHAGSSGMWL